MFISFIIRTMLIWSFVGEGHVVVVLIFWFLHVKGSKWVTSKMVAFK